MDNEFDDNVENINRLLKSARKRAVLENESLGLVEDCVITEDGYLTFKSGFKRLPKYPIVDVDKGKFKLKNYYMKETVKVINKSSNPLPEYSTEGASGLDVRADFSMPPNEKFLFNSSFSNGVLTINPGGRALVSTGLFFGLPKNYEFQVRPRSGLALKQGITILNSPGTLDAKR